MEIYKYGMNTVYVKDGESSFIVLNDPGLTKKVNSLRPSLLINCTGDEFADIPSISSPGEFELSGVYIETLLFDQGKNLFLLEHDDVVLVYMSCDPKELSQDIIDKIASANVVMARVETEPKEIVDAVVDLVNEVEPELFIPLGDEGVFDTLKGFFGNKEVVPEKKLKVKSTDFTGDETITNIALLMKS